MEESKVSTKEELEKIPDVANPVKKKRGRPPGSKAKPVLETQRAAPAAARPSAQTFSPLKAMTPQMLSMIARAPIAVADAGAIAASKGKVSIAKYISEAQMGQVDQAFIGLTGLVDFECTPLELYGYTCLMVVATGAMGALFEYARQYVPADKTPAPVAVEEKGTNHVAEDSSPIRLAEIVPEQSSGSEPVTA